LFFSAAAIYLRAYGEGAWGFPVTGQSHSWRGVAGCFRACGELDLNTKMHLDTDGWGEEVVARYHACVFNVRARKVR
jgi:hypothetical protein